MSYKCVTKTCHLNRLTIKKSTEEAEEDVSLCHIDKLKCKIDFCGLWASDRLMINYIELLQNIKQHIDI